MAKRKRDPTPEPEQSEEESDAEPEEFEINVIDKIRCIADPDDPHGSSWEYHVKWLGYPNPQDDTWEPHSGLEQTVPDLLSRLWFEIDPYDENKDYQIGDEVIPSDRWIRKELKESEKRLKQIEKEKERKKRKKAKDKEERRAKRKKAVVVEESDDEDIAFEISKEEGLHKENQRLRSQKKNKRGVFDRTRELADDLNEGAKSASDVGEASDGDSDAPLALHIPKPSSGVRVAKKKENPYTLERKAASSKVPVKNAGQKRKVTGGREMTVDSEDERPVTKLKKKRTLDPSPATSSARASPAGSAEPVAAKTKSKGKAKAKVVLSDSDDEIALVVRRSKDASPPPATPPAASDADDNSLFGSSPQKALPRSAPTPAGGSAPAKGVARVSAPTRTQEAAATGSAPAGAPAAPRPTQRKSVQMMDASYTDGSVLGTKAIAARAPNMAKAGFPKLKALNTKTTGKPGTPAGSPVIPQGPRSATGTPNLAQHSPAIPQQQSPAIPQHSPAGMSMSPPAAFMDVDGPMVASPVDFSEQAENFLQDFSAAPSVPPTQPAPSRSLGGVKIPKKWKWEGDAFVHRGPNAEPLARVTISDAMDPVPKGMRLNILFKSGDDEAPLGRIKFEKLMSRAQIMSHIYGPATKSPTHLARLVGSDRKDQEVIGALAKHMAAHDLGSYAFMDDSDGHPSALLLLIPSACFRAWTFKSPGSKPDDKAMPLNLSEALRLGPFFVAACQWKVSGEKMSAYTMRPTGDAHDRVLALRRQIAPPDPVPKSTSITLRANPTLERARRIINLPQQLLDFLADQVHRHQYAVWPYPSDGVAMLQKVGAETMMLRDILRAAKAPEVGLESSTVRVLFVHVGSISSLAEVPNIIERRKQQLVQIFTYGTHHTVPPAQWGVREIYVYGGAVTFGVGLVRDACGAARRIAEMAEEHPMWTAFITPSVLALAAYECYGENPVQFFDEHPDQFRHRKLLELITSGRLSLLRKPPTRVASVSDWEEREKWTEWHRDMIFSDERGVLEACLHWYNARYEREFNKHSSNNNLPPEEKWRRFVLEELKTTVNAVMVQPAMIESARRFVVVLGEGEHAVDTVKCGFEWETLSKFSFGDDFWREEDMAEMRQKL